MQTNKKTLDIRNYDAARDYNRKNSPLLEAFTQSLLECFGFYLFSYRRVYNDGRIFHLCSKPDWIENCFSKELWVSQKMGGRADQLLPGERQHYNWIHDLSDPLYYNLREYNIWNGVSVYRKFDTYIELIGFASDRHNNNIMEFYNKHPHIIDEFIYFFKERLRPIIKEGESFLIPASFTGKNDALLDNTMQKKVEQFFKEHAVKRYYYDENLDKHITKREMNIMHLLMEGKTIKEAAQYMDISPRTAESYISQLKTKFECFSKSLLVEVAKKNL